MEAMTVIARQHPPSRTPDIDPINAFNADISFESVQILSQWPALNPEKDDWEMVAPTAAPADVVMDPVVTFDAAALESQRRHCANPKTLKHSQSSPDLRAWNVDDGNDEDTLSAVLVEEDPSVASSSIDMVSGPPSVWSTTSHKLSFKEILLQRTSVTNTNDSPGKSVSKSAKKISFKATKIVVMKPHTQNVSSGLGRHSKSMGNLRALDHIQEEVLGDTDAELFYSQKAMGARGRVNGQKIRPDEAKRLEITMNKKNLQKQRRQG